MAYREPISPKTWEVVAISRVPPLVIEKIRKAVNSGGKVELEYTSFSDPGPDETRLLIDGERVWTIPGY